MSKRTYADEMLADPRLGWAAVEVGLVLLRDADRCSKMSRRELGQEIGLGLADVRSGIAQLKAAGYLHVEHIDGGWRFRVHPELARLPHIIDCYRG